MGRRRATSKSRSRAAGRTDFENKKVRAIIAAARRLFVDEGISAPSMDLIAATAAVSKATVYVYFPDRERLLVALIEYEIESTVPRVLWESGSEVTEIEATLREIARRLLTAFLTFLGNDRVFLRLVEDLSLHSPGLGLRLYAAGPGKIRQQVMDFLTLANTRRLLDVPDVERAAMQLISLVHGDLRIRKTLAMPLPNRQERNEIVDSSVRMFLAAYGC